MLNPGPEYQPKDVAYQENNGDRNYDGDKYSRFVHAVLEMDHPRREYGGDKCAGKEDDG